MPRSLPYGRPGPGGEPEPEPETGRVTDGTASGSLSDSDWPELYASASGPRGARRRALAILVPSESYRSESHWQGRHGAFGTPYYRR